jgi:hypothetical protein
MKKLLIVLVLCLAGMVTHAQDYAAQIGTTRTLTNAQPDTINVTITKSRPSLTFKYDITKTSGTLSGTIVLQGRITGTGTAEAWYTINSYTITDATATTVVSLTANQFVNYRVITAPGASQVAVYKKYLLYRTY